MGDFNRNNRFSRNDSGGRRDFNGGSNRPTTMHQATCSECGKQCEVPFKPTGNKPVYCSDCFQKNGGSDSRRSEEWSPSPRRGNFEERTMFDAVCDNCGKDCKIPFQPRSGKPVYCSSCFENKNDNGGSRHTEQADYSRQFDALNAKIDQILKLLAPATPKKSSKTKEVAEEVVSDQPTQEQSEELSS